MRDAQGTAGSFGVLRCSNVSEVTMPKAQKAEVAGGNRFGMWKNMEGGIDTSWSNPLQSDVRHGEKYGTEN